MTAPDAKRPSSASESGRTPSSVLVAVHDALCGRRNCIGERCVNYAKATIVLRHLDRAEYVILHKTTVLAAQSLSAPARTPSGKDRSTAGADS